MHALVSVSGRARHGHVRRNDKINGNALRYQPLANLSLVADLKRIGRATGLRQPGLEIRAKANLVMRPILDLLELRFRQAQRIEIAHAQALPRPLFLEFRHRVGMGIDQRFHESEIAIVAAQ